MAVIRMSQRDEFEDPRELQEYLAWQLICGRVALFLGAGISIPFGLPTWDELLVRLYSSKGETPPAKAVEEQAEIFHITHFPSDPHGFIDAVRRALYAGVTVDFATLRQNQTIAALGTLMMSSRRGSVSTVVTFNYDDLLEIYLQYHGFVTASIIGERSWAPTADVAIQHPHGFIPFDPAKRATEKLTFTKRSYADAMKPDDVWRQRILTAMRSHTCIFVGLGGNDWNLDSLVLEAQKQHPSADENTAYWGITFTTSTDPRDAVLWEDRGIFVQRVNDYNIDLPPFFFGVAQKAAEFRLTSP